jgi:hypothetical protein
MILKLWPLYDKDTTDTISTQYVCSGKTWLVDFLFWVISISAILMIKLRFSSLRHMWPSHILAILFMPFGFIVPKFGVPIFRFWAYRSDEGYSRNVSCALNLISMFLLVTVTHIGKITLHYIQVCVTSRKADNLWGSNFFGQFMTTSKNDFAFRATASNPFTYMEANILHSSIYVASEEWVVGRCKTSKPHTVKLDMSRTPCFILFSFCLVSILLELFPLYVYFAFYWSFLPYMFNLHYIKVISLLCLIYILQELTPMNV